MIRECKKKNIAFVTLPPPSTNLCQPLDVAFFKSLKSAWSTVVSDYKIQHPSINGLLKAIFLSLILHAFQKMDKGDEKKFFANLISGFKATGIMPVNKIEVLKRLPSYMSDKLMTYLSQKRYPTNTGKKPKQRKTRLRIWLGESVTAHTLEMDSSEGIIDDPEPLQDDDVGSKRKKNVSRNRNKKRIRSGKFILLLYFFVPKNYMVFISNFICLATDTLISDTNKRDQVGETSQPELDSEMKNGIKILWNPKREQ